MINDVIVSYMLIYPSNEEDKFLIFSSSFTGNKIQQAVSRQPSMKVAKITTKMTETGGDSSKLNPVLC